MAENKTKATVQSVPDFLQAIEEAERRADCQQLDRIMSKVAGEPAVMWGSSIVGYGSYHYRYDSGREGDACLVGFSPRKGDISLYLVAEFPGIEALLARLGKHKRAKACLYVRRLSEVDLDVLEQLVAGSYAQRKLNHSC